MEFKDYLKIMVMKDASDIYLTTGAPPSAKFEGVLRPIEPASLPAGKARFKFKAGGLDFRADGYEQFVVYGPLAMLKGTGRIKRADPYGFLIVVLDAQLTSSAGADRFRIKIWDKNNGDAVLYDSQIGCSDLSDGATPCRTLVGGSIDIGK